MRPQNQQEQIRQTLAICRDHWRSSSIPEDQVNSMSEELEEDLRYAVDNGRTVDEVVGPDVQRFARLWAQEDDPLDSPGGRVMVIAIVVVIFLVVALVVGIRLTNYLGLSLPWYVVLSLSAVVAATVVFWTGKSH